MIALQAISQTPAVSELDGNYWFSLTPREKDLYLLGYITSNWLWSATIYYVWQEEDLTLTLQRVYNTYGPVSEAVASRLSQLVDQQYRAQPLTTPLYVVIHTAYNTWQQATNGDNL